MTDIGSAFNPQARSRRRTRRSLLVRSARHAGSPPSVSTAPVPPYPEPTAAPEAQVLHPTAPEPERPALGKLFA